jgi:hypothetical protein
MRLTGYVVVDGKKKSLDWKINGTSVSAGPGLSADEVKVHTLLPNLAKAVNGEPAPIEEVVTSRWDSLTVTELRVELQSRELPVYGNKAQLITRLVENTSEEEEEEVVEEEVVADGNEE